MEPCNIDKATDLTKDLTEVQGMLDILVANREVVMGKPDYHGQIELNSHIRMVIPAKVYQAITTELIAFYQTEKNRIIAEIKAL